MKAILHHVGIAVGRLDLAVRFYQEALGLEVTPPEEVPEQRVRVRLVRTGGASLELIEPTAADSPVARFLARRGPGLHHITLTVPDLDEALARLKARGVQLIDEVPRIGAGGRRIAFVHPSAADGVLVELTEDRADAPR
jgi:methylmalonyl-CoA/ethylmalonyl-CoA epimerase